MATSTNGDIKAKTFSGKQFSEVDHITNADGKHLFCKYWKSAENDPRFLVCMVHGLGGHCARFEELALLLNSLGGFAFAHDHVGHGESEGNRTTVSNYQFLIRDILQHVKKMKETHPNLPMFLFGQSMGGALALLAASQKPDLFRGVIVLGGMLTTNPQMASPFKKFLVSAAASVLPSVGLATLDESKSSRDPKEVESVLNDPLKSSTVKSEMALQLLKITEALKEVVGDISLPFLALHGGADVTCDPEGSKWLHQTAKSSDKTLKIYEGCYHDLIHELPEDKRQCIDDIGNWINERV